MPGEYFLALALEAVKKLDWLIGYKSETGFMAFTTTSMESWSEEIKVIAEGQTIRLTSECTGGQLIDWGKNRRNIERLLQKIEELKTGLLPEKIASLYEDLKPNLIPANECVLSIPTPTLYDKVVNSLFTSPSRQVAF
jgi:rhomboid protease GluP